MRLELKKRIICKLPFIADNTSNVNIVITHLINRFVLDFRERDNILSHPSRYDKCVDLCSTILTKDDRAYDHFLGALEESSNGRIAQYILEPLTPEQESQTFEQCLFSLDMVIKDSKAERKLQFCTTLEGLNTLVFQHIGKSERNVFRRRVFRSYYVLRDNGERLFQLGWGFKTKYGTKCMRFCKNLVGKSIMNLNIPMTSKNISVGHDFLGSVRIGKGKWGDWSWFTLKHFEVLDSVNETVYYVKLIYGSTSSSKAVWEMSTQKYQGKIVAKFGHLFSERHDSEKTGVIYKEDGLTALQKSLIFGSAVVIMDRSKQGTLVSNYWKRFGGLVLSFLLLVLVILGVIYLPGLFKTDSEDNSNYGLVYLTH